MQDEKEICIPVPWDIFEDMLDRRREWWDDGQHREIPDSVWEFTLEIIRECGGMVSPKFNDPAYIVDNLVVNGSWEDYDEFRKYSPEYDDVPDDELEDAAYQRGAVAVFAGERLILWNTGL